MGLGDTMARVVNDGKDPHLWVASSSVAWTTRPPESTGTPHTPVTRNLRGPQDTDN